MRCCSGKPWRRTPSLTRPGRARSGPEHLGILALARVAGDDDELRDERLVRGQLDLDAEVARAVDHELAEETERCGHPLPSYSRRPPTTRSSGWSRNSAWATTPKLPPPEAPRAA